MAILTNLWISYKIYGYLNKSMDILQNLQENLINYREGTPLEGDVGEVVSQNYPTSPLFKIRSSFKWDI